jgi:hypothetical protein
LFYNISDLQGTSLLRICASYTEVLTDSQVETLLWFFSHPVNSVDVYEFLKSKNHVGILPVFGVAGKGQTISGHGRPTTNLQTMRRLFIHS